MERIFNEIGVSEYDNQGALYTQADDEELLGAVKRDPKGFLKSLKTLKIKRGISNVPNVTSERTASRAEIERRFNLLAPELKKGLKAKQLQLMDATVYNTRSIAGKTRVLVYEDTEQRAVGVRNISSGKLPKDEVFLLSAIQILYGVGSKETEDAAGIGTVTEWTEIPQELQSGEFTFRANRKMIIDQLSMSVFANHSKTNTTVEASGAAVGGYGYSYGEGLPGFYKLANPKLIETQVQMDMEAEWLKVAPAGAFIKVILHGTKVTKY